MVKKVLQCDSRGRLVLSGRANEMFLVRENSDGSILLQPATVVSAAQAEYDGDPSLRELLEHAAASDTVSRDRRPRT
jgi:hypothetical protein